MSLAPSLSLILMFPVMITIPVHSVYASETLANEAQNTAVAASWGAWLLAGVLLLIAAFYAIRGPITLPRETDHATVHRFSVYQRITHWFLVLQFLLLAVTGLILLYGPLLLESLFGVDGFAAIASAATAVHNLFGPLFLFGLLLLIPQYIRHNLPNSTDLSWFTAAGGYFRGHAHAHRFNAGEKVWFWLVCVCGLGLSISGLLLEFNASGPGETIEFVYLIHVAIALVMIVAAAGHIYLATVGTEGTLQGMLHGSVARRWAAKHHDLWLKEIDASANEPEDKP